jgi:hypothetical protein
MCDASRLESICDGDQLFKLPIYPKLKCSRALMLNCGMSGSIYETIAHACTKRRGARLFSSPRQARYLNAGTPRCGGWNSNSLTAGIVMLRLSLR